jgi:hypothetical protein
MTAPAVQHAVDAAFREEWVATISPPTSTAPHLADPISESGFRFALPVLALSGPGKRMTRSYGLVHAAAHPRLPRWKRVHAQDLATGHDPDIAKALALLSA